MFKKLRVEKGMSTQDVAKALGVSVSYVEKLEAGHRSPGLKLAVRIANLYGKTLDSLFCAHNVDKKCDKNKR